MFGILCFQCQERARKSQDLYFVSETCTHNYWGNLSKGKGGRNIDDLLQLFFGQSVRRVCAIFLWIDCAIRSWIDVRFRVHAAERCSDQGVDFIDEVVANQAILNKFEDLLV